MTKSAAQEIRDAAFDLIDGITFFKTKRKTPALTVEPGDLPMVGVFILREDRDADGDANTGEPRFYHRLTLGVSGSVEITNEEQKQLALEETLSAIETVLLTNPDFVKMHEGVLSMTRRQQYTKANETALAEIQIEMVIGYRTRWQPVIPDDLETIRMKTLYPDTTSEDKVPQTGYQVTLPQN